MTDPNTPRKFPEADSTLHEGSFRQTVLRFRSHPLAIVCMVMIALLYLASICAGFLSPHDPNATHVTHVHAPPSGVRIFHEGSLHRPFVYPLRAEFSEDGMERFYTQDRSNPVPVRVLVRSDETYRFLGLVETNVRLVGTTDEKWFPLGTDRLGRDLLSRIFYGSRVSLTIGVVGVLISTILGTLIGTLSGYFGGWVDNLVQRSIEILMSFPAIPLWIALAAALPPHWSPTAIYFGIVVILSLVGWGGLARQIRGLVLSYRERDFVLAARASGASHWYIIKSHLIPSCTGFLVVVSTLAIPATILGETALSFLGLGVRPPMISWGVLLEEAQRVRVLVQYPWLLLPAVPVLLTVVTFNLLGDSLRDALEPEGGR